MTELGRKIRAGRLRTNSERFLLSEAKRLNLPAGYGIIGQLVLGPDGFQEVLHRGSRVRSDPSCRPYSGNMSQ